MKNTLLVIDMQNDFIDGSLGTPEAVKIVDNVADKIAFYKKNEDNVIFTRDTHGQNYLETPEGKKLPIVHCVKDSIGWQISSKLDISGAKIIDKPSFGYTGWSGFNLQNIEIVGLCTDICVVSNALILKAMFPDSEITVDASCCAGVTIETHRDALSTMKMCQINVINE